MKPHRDSIPQAAQTTATQVAPWAHQLARLHARIGPRFARPEPRRRALAYLQGIMSSIERKNGWQLGEHAREGAPYRMQRLLASAAWDADLVRDDLRSYVLQHLGSLQGILVLDETSFPKRGTKSAGVQKQYCGTTGHVENCQVAVFLSSVSEKGHTLIDRALYLPVSWIDDRPRCQQAHIPDSVSFATKCELARRMVERIWQAEIPIDWVVAESVYGGKLDLRTWLEQHGYSYVLAVACDEPVALQTPTGRRQVPVSEVEALLLHPHDWQRLSMSQGTKGPRLFDWVAVPLLHQWVDDDHHWLLIRGDLADPCEKTYYLVFAPQGTQLAEMVKAIGASWQIEEDVETAKDLGLDDYEVRSWLAWYRHVTLVMLAHALLTVICTQDKAQAALTAASLPAGSSSAPLPALLEAALTVPEVRHLLARLIWPLACRTKLVLAWSSWRRCHRSLACYYHTKRRLQAG